jgi:hypothetical protein
MGRGAKAVILQNKKPCKLQLQCKCNGLSGTFTVQAEAPTAGAKYAIGRGPDRSWDVSELW